MGICALGCGNTQGYQRYSSVQLYRPSNYMFKPILRKNSVFNLNFNVYGNPFLQRLEKRSLLTKNPISTFYISFLSHYDTSKLKALIAFKHVTVLKIIISFEHLNMSDIKHISRFISLQNRLSGLYIHFWRNHLLDQPKLVLLLESVGRLVNLRTLVLTFKGSDFLGRSQLTDDNVKVFSKALKKLRRLRKLYLDFPLRNYVSEVGFIRLQKAIGKLSDLEEICFNCAIFSSHIAEENLHNNISIGYSIESSIGKLRSLKKLSVIIPSNPKPEKGILLAISKVVNRLSQLKHLHVEVQKLEISSQEMTVFLEALSQAKKLEFFYTNFDLKPTLSEGKFPSFQEWLTALAKMKQITVPLFEEQQVMEQSHMKEIVFGIKSLDLRDHFNIQNNDMSKYLQKLSNLTHLRWETHSHKITIEFISSVQVSLGSIPTLRELDITISTYEFPEKLALKFINTLTECSSLGSLKMMIQHLTPSKLGEVFRAFGNLLSQLRCLSTFHLKLPGLVWKEISDSAFSAFCKGLSKLEGLRDLCLNFSRPSQILEDVLFILGQTLSLCPKLEYLSLILEFCHNVPDQAELGLLKNINALKNLRKFELNLRNPNSHRLLEKRIGDEILIVLCQGLIKSQKLTNLRLNFEGNEITDTGINTLCKTLKKLNLLKNLHLDFSGCCKITSKGINYLKGMYALLNQLEPLHLLEETALEGFILHDPSQFSFENI